MDKREIIERLLDAYNEGLGDGMVAATAIMSTSGDKTIAEIKAGIDERRKHYASRALSEKERRDG